MSVSRKRSNTDDHLDPLFDYSKMQPPTVFLDDDDDDSDDDVQILNPNDHRNSIDGKVNLDTGDIKPPTSAAQTVKVLDDSDWLEPPPSKTGCHRVLPADPMMLKLRQQREELQKIWKAGSAESVKDMEEAVRLEAMARHRLQQEVSKQNPVSESPKDGDFANKKPKVLLKLQGLRGDPHAVKFGIDEKFEKLFAHYADKLVNRPVSNFVFRFDGMKIDANKTPKDYDLEDEDLIEVVEPAATKRC